MARMPEPLKCNCELVEKTPVAGKPGVFDYSYECTWNQGDTNRYNVYVRWTDDTEAMLKAEEQCQYEPKDK